VPLGFKTRQSFWIEKVMSALPPKADIAEQAGRSSGRKKCAPAVGRDELGFRQELCHIPSIAFADVYRAFQEIFWLPMLTAKRLRKVLSYAPTTGIFRWKVSASSRAPVGAIAGAKNGRGYHQIRIGGRPYSASRLAWLYMTGKWPNSELSYINGKPSDTRWANLQEAPSSQNRSRLQRK
jgi:hypothetical protein